MIAATHRAFQPIKAPALWLRQAELVYGYAIMGTLVRVSIPSGALALPAHPFKWKNATRAEMASRRRRGGWQ